MDKLTSFMESNVLPVANKIARNKYISSISNGLLSVMPFMVVGCFAMIIWCPPLSSADTTGLVSSIMAGWESLASALDMPLNFICSVTLDWMALYSVAAIAFHLAKANKLTGYLPIACAFICFMITAGFDAEGASTTAYFGSAGLFTGIVMTIFSIELLTFLIKKKFGRIEIAGGNVPPAITESFISLFPVFVVVIASALIAWVTILVTGAPLPKLIATIVGPIANVINHPIGIVLLAFLIGFFWWFGIHDSAITGTLDPFLKTMLLANATAVMAGAATTDLPYIVSSPFLWIFLTVGGSGATLSLAILLLFFAKSKHLKMVGKLGIVPALFNINEPILFGMPIVLNPMMFIPFVLAMPINAIICYICFALKIVATPYLYPSWNLFAPFGALLSTMDWKAVILMFVLIAVDMILYYPFFKMVDNQKVAEENGK